MNVSLMILSTEIPIKDALAGLSETARIALPRFVLLTKSSKSVIEITATTRIRICLGARIAPPIFIVVVDKRSGKTLGLAPQIIIASV